MKEVFETFNPKNSLIKEYVDYYYLDIKPYNKVNEFQCFPHFNNTISLYKSHIRSKNREMIFKEAEKPFQIFTPIRTKVLNVRQIGKVYRIVIVFHPLGVQQFYKEANFDNTILGFSFFTEKELKGFFSSPDTDTLTNMLDTALQKRFKKSDHPILEQCLGYIFKNYNKLSVSEISGNIGVSRQYLNKVFRSVLGISVKKFCEIVVFRQTIYKKLFVNPDESFTKLAYEFNYSDQSHFIKTYKSLTSYPPKSFFLKGTVFGKTDTFWHVQT